MLLPSRYNQYHMKIESLWVIILQRKLLSGIKLIFIDYKYLQNSGGNAETTQTVLLERIGSFQSIQNIYPLGNYEYARGGNVYLVTPRTGPGRRNIPLLNINISPWLHRENIVLFCFYKLWTGNQNWRLRFNFICTCRWSNTYTCSLIVLSYWRVIATYMYICIKLHEIFLFPFTICGVRGIMHF